MPESKVRKQAAEKKVAKTKVETGWLNLIGIEWCRTFQRARGKQRVDGAIGQNTRFVRHDPSSLRAFRLSSNRENAQFLRHAFPNGNRHPLFLEMLQSSANRTKLSCLTQGVGRRNAHSIVVIWPVGLQPR